MIGYNGVKDKLNRFTVLSAFFVGLFVVFSSCARSGFQEFYHPIIRPNRLHPSPYIEWLKPDQEPKVIQTENLERDIMMLLSKRYIVLGYSDFNGPYEDMKNASAQAKGIGATIVLTQCTSADTQTVYLKDNNQHDDWPPDQGSKANEIKAGEPSAADQKRYGQKAFYFVKDTEKTKLGIRLANLTQEMRTNLNRNTGALILAVLENSPASDADIANGDILIAIDDIEVINAEQVVNLSNQMNDSVHSCLFTVLRHGEEKRIKVEFGNSHPGD